MLNKQVTLWAHCRQMVNGRVMRSEGHGLIRFDGAESIKIVPKIVGRNSTEIQ